MFHSLFFFTIRPYYILRKPTWITSLASDLLSTLRSKVSISGVDKGWISLQCCFTVVVLHLSTLYGVRGTLKFEGLPQSTKMLFSMS